MQDHGSLCRRATTITHRRRRVRLTLRERWKPIVGYEGSYSVSDRGRVRSEARQVSNRFVRERILKPGVVFGYEFVGLWRSNHVNQQRVHRLVLGSFTGPCPDGYEGCHLNGDCADNRVGNLAWQTSKQNTDDSRRHGTLSQGTNHYLAKLTEAEVFRIRKSNDHSGTLSRRYGVSRATIRDVIRGRTWSWLV